MIFFFNVMNDKGTPKMHECFFSDFFDQPRPNACIHGILDAPIPNSPTHDFLDAPRHNACMHDFFRCT